MPLDKDVRDLQAFCEEYSAYIEQTEAVTSTLGPATWNVVGPTNRTDLGIVRKISTEL